MGGINTIDTTAIKAARIAIAGHQFRPEDNEFQLILNPTSDARAVYRAATDAVNAMNSESKDVSYSLFSIADKHNEILAISGVSADKLDIVRSRIMESMSERGYTSYAPTNLPVTGAALAIA